MQMLDKVLKEIDPKVSSKKPERKPDSKEKNVIALDQKLAEGLADEIDRHQCSMYVLYHQYQKHHWLVEGPQFRDLHLYLEASYGAVQKDLDALAERMTFLGGIPTSSPTALAKKSYIEHEPEGFFPIRTMLENDLAAEQILCQTLRTTIAAARKGQDFGTARLLEHVLEGCEDRAHHLDHYLAEDGLRA